MIKAEIKCKTIVSPSGIPGCDFAVNPFVGCSHACVYCYAKFMKKFTDHEEPWGEFLDVRVNAAEAAVKQLRSGKYRGKSVLLSSVTDPYQPAEKEYRLMRELLPLLAEFGMRISILTKSSLVARDADILSRIEGVSVGVSMTGIDEQARMAFEPGASPYADRLVALEQLSAKGIETHVFVGPILPGVTDRDFDILMRAIRDAGAGSIMFDALNYADRNLPLLLDAAIKVCPESAPLYGEAPEFTARSLKKKIREFQKSSGIPCSIVF